MPSPKTIYRALRAQLGSVRNVYLPATDIAPSQGQSGDKEVVLLIHGFFQTRNIWDAMAHRLRQDNYHVLNFELNGKYSRLNTRPVDQLAKLVAERVEQAAKVHGFEKLHIIGHSKGGVVGRRYVQHFGGARRTQSLITLGTPHRGTPTALAGLGLLWLSSNPRELLPRSKIVQALNKDPFPSSVPMVSLFSTGDFVCPHWCSRLVPRVGEVSLTNIELSGLGHCELTWDLGVYHRITGVLRDAAQRQRG